jgi:MOB kinase activator 1
MSPNNRPLPDQPPPPPPSNQSNNRQSYEYHLDDQNGEQSTRPIGSNKYDLRDAVKLPDREDPNEWIANNLFDFHKQVYMLFGTISEHCESCPEMTAGQHKYLWSSGPERRPVELRAADYIVHSLDWIQEQLDDEDVFPSMSLDKEFPQDFRTVCEAIARRLFRVFAHVYHHHLTHVRMAKIEAHMNTSLKHFIYFVREFNLITAKEWEPLRDYVDKLDIMSIGNMRITN